MDLLKAAYPALTLELQIVKTQGDVVQDAPLAKIGGKGLFTKELEQSLDAREIDFAVHSLKDLPVELPAGLMLAAYLTRECPNDALVSKDRRKLSEIPRNGTIATGSLRRKCQLLRYRPDVQIVDVRGNIETRLAKLTQNNWDGLILAYAALQRLGKTEVITEIIPAEVIYPAVGQGIIAVECRTESAMAEFFAAINDHAAETCAIAERAFLQGLGGGCQVPVGVISTIRQGQLELAGVYLPEDGKYWIKEKIIFDAGQPRVAGERLAEKISKKYHELRLPTNDTNSD